MRYSSEYYDLSLTCNAAEGDRAALCREIGARRMVSLLHMAATFRLINLSLILRTRGRMACLQPAHMAEHNHHYQLEPLPLFLLRFLTMHRCHRSHHKLTIRFLSLQFIFRCSLQLYFHLPIRRCTLIPHHQHHSLTEMHQHQYRDPLASMLLPLPCNQAINQLHLYLEVILHGQY